MRLCLIEGCGKKHYAKDKCLGHYVDSTREERVAAQAKWRNNNPEKAEEWHKNNPEKVLAHARTSNLRRYGVTQDWYDEKLSSQGGGCAICGTKEPGHGFKNFCVDHDHETGEARGLLCRTCNAGLGHFKDSQDLLRKANLYLMEHHSDRPLCLLIEDGKMNNKTQLRAKELRHAIPIL